MADRAFEVPRLAELYDVLDPDRSDLEVYAGIVRELDAASVLDIGCGTGTFALMLAASAVAVTALDPAGASLEVARRKPGADHVTWIHGDCSVLPAMQVDAVTMTANVAQVFVADDAWNAVLDAAYRSLRPGGHVAFEVRRPEARAWEKWTKDLTWQRVDVGDGETVETWLELVEVTPTTVSFRGTCRFASDGEVLTSESTLRFRTREEITGALRAAGFAEPEVRDAPDRPGLENVFIARRA